MKSIGTVLGLLSAAPALLVEAAPLSTRALPTKLCDRLQTHGKDCNTDIDTLIRDTSDAAQFFGERTQEEFNNGRDYSHYRWLAGEATWMSEELVYFKEHGQGRAPPPPDAATSTEPDVIGQLRAK